MNTEETAVVIIGAGPVGLLLAHVLGRAGVNTVILELAAELPDEPRAVGLDPETLRTLQYLDVLDVVEEDLMQGMTGGYYNGDGELLFYIDDDQPGPLGYPQLAGFSQPRFVAKLAAELARYSCVDLRYQHSLEAFEQSDNGVTATVQCADSEGYEIAAQYLVGCDGGRSTVRKQLGIAMHGVSNPQPWLVIDTVEKEYDGKRNYRFFCDPKRPGMFIQTPHNNRRWEWMLLPGEDRDEFLKDETIHALLEPHIDISGVDIYRRRVYDFSAIIAERFQQGRVFLAGDAAHMTPPFAGQGLNSGVRDALNLGWKLVAVLRDGVPAALLETYEAERWDHAKELIDVAVDLGKQIQPTDPEAAAARDAGFAEMNKDRDTVDGFVNGIFRALLDRYFSAGFAIGLGEQYLAGRMFSQPKVTNGDGREGLLDEFLGPGFAILGYNCDPAQELGNELAAWWREHGVSVLGLRDDGASGELALAPGSHVAELFERGGAKLVLLRPDRFCMAAFDADSAEQTLSEAADMLGLN